MRNLVYFLIASTAFHSAVEACTILPTAEARKQQEIRLQREMKNSDAVVVGRLIEHQRAKQGYQLVAIRVTRGVKQHRYSVPILPTTCTNVIFDKPAIFYLEVKKDGYHIVHSQLAQ